MSDHDKRRARDDRGAATLLVVAMTGLLIFVTVGLAVVGGIVVTHRKAQSAADLAALAGASALAQGAGGCRGAEAIANANDAALVECSVDGRDVTVRVRVTGPRAVGRSWDATVSARAGPAR